MDELDIQILKELTKDAQTPFSTIATRIGTSTRTVIQKFERMKKDGIILRSAVTIDLSKLGYQGKAFLKITNAQNQNRKATIDALSKMQNIILSTEIIGDFYVLAVVAVKDFRGIIRLINEVQNLPSVDHVDVSFTDETAFPVGKGFERVI
jgi:DNA-binding Lrp family transcriptional regulator